MPIKELQFSFSISVEALARALATSNTGMRVQVLGTDAEELNGHHTVKALPPPAHGARETIIAFMKAHPDRTITTHELIVVCNNLGFKTNNVYNTLHNMKEAGLLRTCGKAKYRLSKKGRA